MTVASALRQYPFEPFTGDLPRELLDMIVSNPVSRVALPDGRPVWLLLGYEDCCTALSDPRFSRLPLGSTALPDGEGRDLNMDGPPHAGLRRVAARAFTARRIDTFRHRVQRLVDELVDAVLAGPRPADLVGALVAPLPLLVVCDVLGVAAADRRRFYGWLAELNSVHAYGSAGAEAAQGELRRFLAGQLAAKRAEPGDDLLSAWLESREAHELSDPEIVDLAMGVLLGGIEINATTAGLRALFRHPEQLRKLLDAPEKLGAATDEILRYTAVSSLFRVQVVVEDVILSGVKISAGESVMAIPWVGNRDPRVFPDPDVFDIDRVPTAPHLTFGFGPHYCLGSALGRMQVELSIGTLLRRLPGMAPAIPQDQIPWRHDRVNCGIAAFPVTWDEQAAGKAAPGQSRERQPAAATGQCPVK